ncbi:MrcB family domain-containing protein [Anaerotignum propionicum]|uniref:Uncharacterized protein n=1 Tax=Anaerotignum propionicum DSM 1682 TaxID=991789 RepID=A0A0X8VBP0_ANAPI|nr:DUF3578 domain-containing protein [Anaerotignum propionicum]AMJ41968.1 hypothetical protein CPRO_24020 [Anaerotignum propionicum DSM 1682]SHE93814.1 protein of unknown function [[Clostridium] propionicum DSM 1682] [Anaerotignum propionicum DSM 1682]
MKDILEKVLQNYSNESRNNLEKNPLANYIRNDIPKNILSELQLNSNQFKITASPGNGNWAAVPWIGIFDIDITNTATKGYDVVYLFKADMSGVYLSLNQGWTYFRETFKAKEGKLNIQKVATIWQKILATTLNDFTFDPIDLKAQGKHSDLPRGYELGHICGKYYDAHALPCNQVLVDDLRKMLSVYRELKGRMHNCSTEKTNNYILAGAQADVFYIDDRNDELNRVIINPVSFSLTLQKPPNVLQKNGPYCCDGRKVNHINKQIHDMKIGLAGEKMVIEYEKKRLTDEGRVDLIKSIEHTSQKIGDGTGYDIVSFDKNGNKRYIEVKTTSGDKDTPFLISDNEVQFSILNSESYSLYRVYNFNAKANAGLLYIINGDLRKTFRFKATNYISSEFI